MPLDYNNDTLLTILNHPAMKKSGPKTCVSWRGQHTRGGNGGGTPIFYYDGEAIVVYRYLAHHLIQNVEGMHVHHLCHNHRCININHLRVLTPGEHTHQHWNPNGNRKNE